MDNHTPIISIKQSDNRVEEWVEDGTIYVHIEDRPDLILKLRCYQCGSDIEACIDNNTIKIKPFCEYCKRKKGALSD